MKRKVIALLLVSILILALAACGESPASAPPSAEPAVSPSPAGNSSPEPSVAAAEPDETVTWPSGDVTIYIPADVGAPLDLASRVMMDWLSEKTGANFIAENDTTGGGARLAELLKTAKPDGSTLMFCGCGQMIPYYSGIWTSSLADESAYTVVAPNIGQAVPSGAVLVTQVDQPFSTWDETVEYIKANPQTLTVAIVNGTPHEIRLKLLFDEYELTDLVRWVSASNNDAVTGVLGGSISLAMLTETVGPQYILDGTLKGIINSRPDRGYADDELKPALDSVPTLADVTENYEALCVSWPMLIVGPAGMSDELCEYINEQAADIINSEEFMDRVYGLGGTNTYQPATVEEIRAVVKAADEQIAGAYR